MDMQTLIDAYRPDNDIEREALQIVCDRVGTYPDCRSCPKCCAACQLINDDYSGLIESMQ